MSHRTKNCLVMFPHEKWTGFYVGGLITEDVGKAERLTERVARELAEQHGGKAMRVVGGSDTAPTLVPLDAP